jgi:hypothetical protein
LRVQFHSVTKPLRFPELLDDTRPGEPRPDVGERVLGRVAAMTGG